MKRSFQLFASAFLSVLIVITMVGMVFVHYTCPKCEAMHDALTLCSSDEDAAAEDCCADVSMACYTLQVVRLSTPTAEVWRLAAPAPVLMALQPGLISLPARPLAAAGPRAPRPAGSAFAPPPRGLLSRLCTLLI